MATVNVYYRQNPDARTDSELKTPSRKPLGLKQSNYILVGQFESGKDPSEIFKAYQFEYKTDWEHLRYQAVANQFDAGNIDHMSMGVGDVMEINQSLAIVAKTGFVWGFWK